MKEDQTRPHEAATKQTIISTIYVIDEAVERKLASLIDLEARLEPILSPMYEEEGEKNNEEKKILKINSSKIMDMLQVVCERIDLIDEIVDRINCRLELN